MLKSLIIAVIAVVASMTLLAQQEKPKLKWAADLGGTSSLIGISQRVEFQLGVSAFLKSHQFRAAPIIQIWSSEAASNPDRLSLTGFLLNYIYSIPTESKKFELFFKYEMALQFFKNSWNGTYYNSSIGSYESYSDESREIFFSNSIAYGFSYKPRNNVFLRLDAGGGLYISSIKGSLDNYNEQTNAQYDFRGYDDVGWFLKFSFTAGYIF